MKPKTYLFPGTVDGYRADVPISVNTVWLACHQAAHEHGRGVRKNLTEALNWYRISAERGEPIAQSNLASLYFLGRGVRQDDEKAAIWFGKAAALGLPEAQSNLAYMYYNGRGVTVDYVEAAKWTRLAAEQRYASAETDLGFLYEQGKGVPLDYVTAYVWYSAGAAGGDQRATGKLKTLSQLMSRTQIAEAKSRAFPESQQLEKSTGLRGVVGLGQTSIFNHH